MTMRNIIILSVCTWLVACEPCTDCTSEATPPTIATKLFDIDRLTEVQDSLVLFNEIEVFTDSLLIYGDSIENFDKPYQAKKQEFADDIDALTDLRIGKQDSVFAEARDSVEALLVQNQTFLSIGRISIDLLSIDQTDFEKSYDSVATHSLPLILSDEQTNMRLLIDDEQFTVNVTYTLSDEMDEDNRVVRKAFIESLSYSDMDTVFCLCNGIDTVSCSSFSCEAANSSISCYF